MVTVRKEAEERFVPDYDLPKKLVPTGFELWIASQKMPASIPRLVTKTSDGLSAERENLEGLISDFIGRAGSAENYGYLPLVQHRNLAERQPNVLDNASVFVPGDGSMRSYGLLWRLPSSKAARSRSFYGPIVNEGNEEFQFYTGDSKVSDFNRSALAYGHRRIKNLLNSEKSYVELVKVS